MNTYKFSHIDQEVEIYAFNNYVDNASGWGYCAEPSGEASGWFATPGEAIAAAVAEIEAAIIEAYGSIAGYHVAGFEREVSREVFEAKLARGEFGDF